MSLTLTATKSEALIPALTSSLAQLQPVMAQTQESLQGLVAKVTDALARSEERGRKLEAELIAEKSHHAADKAAYEQRFKAQEALIDTMQKAMEAMQKRMTTLEGQTKYIRPAVKAMVTYGAKSFIELDYPGKNEDVALRNPVLQAQITSNKQISRDGKSPGGRADLNKALESLEVEAARIAAFEAREGKSKEQL